MIRKTKINDMLITLVLIAQLGFHTNVPHDDIISLAITFICLIGISYNRGSVTLNLDRSVKNSIIWYSTFVFFCFVSIFWATHRNRSMVLQLIVEVYIPFVLTALAISGYLKKEENPHHLLALLIYSECFVCIRALLNTPIQIITNMDSRLYGSGLGVNYNHFTTQLTLIVCIEAFQYFVMREKRIINKVVFSFLIFNIILSGSRKAIFSSVFIIAITYIISDWRKKGKTLLKIIVALLAVYGVFYLTINNAFLFDLVGNKMLALVNTLFKDGAGIRLDNSALVRNELREKAISVFLSHPLLGVGYYCFPHYNTYGLYAHSNYFEILADLGIGGFATYYSLYFSQLFTGIQRIKKENNSYELLKVLFFVTLLILEYAQVTFYRMYSLVPLLVVYIVIEYTRARERK